MGVFRRPVSVDVFIIGIGVCIFLYVVPVRVERTAADVQIAEHNVPDTGGVADIAEIFHGVYAEAVADCENFNEIGRRNVFDLMDAAYRAGELHHSFGFDARLDKDILDIECVYLAERVGRRRRRTDRRAVDACHFGWGAFSAAAKKKKRRENRCDDGYRFFHADRLHVKI